jgi:surface antigen
MEGVRMQSLAVCSQTDRTHIVVKEDTLTSIATHYDLDVRHLVAYNRLSNSDSVYINQSICIPSLRPKMMHSAMLAFMVPGRVAAPLVMVKHVDQMLVEKRYQPAVPAFQAVKTSPSSRAAPYVARSNFVAQAPMGQTVNYRNAYPFGQCTWWAAQRYYQLHNVSVPWMNNSNAGEWVGRAQNFGWHVSSVPKVGSILVLHQNVQGAGSVGHVAVVEKVLGNGTVIASSMNWGNHPRKVTNSWFHQGSGVSFINP